jgi:hypothetical protein
MKCIQQKGVIVVLAVPKSTSVPHPTVTYTAPVCRRGANRDRNGAANILLKTTGRWVYEDNNTSQPPFPMITASSRGGGTGFLP